MTTSDRKGATRKRHSSAATVHDVAEFAGVSPITVSRCINNPGLVAPATLERVRAAIEASGYVPNLMAGALRMSRSRLIAALVPTIAGPIFFEMVQELTSSLNEEGYQLILGQTGYGNPGERALLDAIIGRRPDGIIVTGLVASSEMRNRLRTSGIPVVETWDLADDPIDMLVGFSHRQIGETVCQYLYDKGYRRPVLLSGNDERAVRRASGFADMALKLGMGWSSYGTDARIAKDALQVPVVLTPSPTTMAHGRTGFAQLIANYEGFDSIFCSSDMLAVGALTEAGARGIRVPQELAMIGFGDTDFTSSLNPALTTVKIDGLTIARTAKHFVLERIRGRNPKSSIVDVGFSIVERDSA